MGGGNSQHSASGLHRLYGVNNNVKERYLDFLLVQKNTREIFVKFLLELHPVEVEPVDGEADGFLQDVGDMCELQVEFARARRIKHLCNELFDAVSVTFNNVSVECCRFIFPGHFVLQLLERQVEVGKWIPYFVS